MGFSRQGYWSGLPFPPPGDLPDPRIKPASLKSPTLAGGFFITSTKCHIENTSKVEWIGPRSFALFSIFTWLLATSTTFCRENVSTTSRTQKIFLRVHWILKYGFLCVLSHFSYVWLCATLWTVVHQAPLSMGFSRQEYWSGLLCPSPRNISDPGIEPPSLMYAALAGGFFTTSTTWEATDFYDTRINKHFSLAHLCWLCNSSCFD